MNLKSKIAKNKTIFLIRSEAREDPYTDYYIWKDANNSNPGGLPNNW